MKQYAVRAEVILVSEKPATKKPDYANVGGFTVVKPDGVPVHFDWTASEGNLHTVDNGHLKIVWELQGFDSELFETSNEDSSSLDWAEIVKGNIDEVYYEAGYVKDGEESHLPMTLQSFEIFTYEDGVKFFPFTDEQIQTYNDMINNQQVVS